MAKPASRTARVVAASLVSQGAVWALLVYALGIRRFFYAFFDVSDVPLYFEYAKRMAQGLVPFVQWDIEYPPLALPLFAIPGHTTSLGDYQVWFAAEMIAISMLVGALTAYSAALLQPTGNRPYVVAGLYSAGVLLMGAIVANRYDVAVSLVLVVVVVLLAKRKMVWAAFALGIGFALKLTPLILLPLVLILCEDARALARSAAAFAASALLPFLAVVIAGGAGGLQYLFNYHLSRPLEIETLFASPFMLAISNGWMQGAADTRFGSQTILAPGVHVAGALAGPLTLGAIVLAYWLIWRRRELLRQTPRVVPLAMLAISLGFVVFGKVLSPQYLIWLLPLVALVAVYRPVAATLVLSAVLMTHILFPAHYWNFVNFQPEWTLLVAVRNVLLLAAWVLLVRSLWRLPERAPGRS